MPETRATLHKMPLATKGTGRAFAIFLAGFVVLWALRATVLYGIDRMLPAGDPRLWYGVLIKLLVWAGAAVAYVHWVRREPPLRTLRVSTLPNRRALPGAALAVVAYLAAAAWDVCRTHGIPVGALWGRVFAEGVAPIACTALSAFVEEVFFRGLVLTELSERFRFWAANAGSAALFVLVHWPFWLWTRGLDQVVLRDSGAVFLLALVLGYLVRKTGSIWPGTLLHVLNNCLSGAQ